MSYAVTYVKRCVGKKCELSVKWPRLFWTTMTNGARYRSEVSPYRGIVLVTTHLYARRANDAGIEPLACDRDDTASLPATMRP